MIPILFQMALLLYSNVLLFLLANDCARLNAIVLPLFFVRWNGSWQSFFFSFSDGNVNTGAHYLKLPFLLPNIECLRQPLFAFPVPFPLHCHRD